MTAEKAHYTPQIDGENDAPPHPVAEAPSRPPPPESTCPATSRSVTKSVLLFVAGVVLKAAPCELFLMSSSLCIVSDVVLALHAPLRGPHAPGSACTSPSICHCSSSESARAELHPPLLCGAFSATRSFLSATAAPALSAGGVIPSNFVTYFVGSFPSPSCELRFVAFERATRTQASSTPDPIEYVDPPRPE